MTQTTPSRPGDLLTLAEVAVEIGVTYNTIRTYWQTSRLAREEGKVRRTDMPAPDKTYGRSPVWKRSTIARWEKKRTLAHERRERLAEQAQETVDA